MIHVELSVPPHYKDVRYKPNSLIREDDSPPPAVIFSKQFATWRETKAFLDFLEIKTDSQAYETVCDNPTNEYAQVELEVLDRTGHIYIEASLSIEGQEG